jgi:hypothetical protein
MKRLIGICIVAALISSIISLVAGQNISSQLTDVADKIERSISEKMSGWEHRRGEPIVKSENVLLSYWYFQRRVVKISVVPHKSASEARDALQRFARDGRSKEQLGDLGEEGYSWGADGSEVAFRKGNLTIYVSTNVEIDGPETAMLSREERGKRKSSEEKKLNREFAKLVADALK